MYQGHDGKLTLFNKERKIIAIRTKLTQNLYKFSFKVIKQEYISQSIYALSSQPVQGWEVWHKHYGHVNYDSLKYLYNKNLVEGLDINTKTNTLDCPACIQGKQMVCPFKGHHTLCHEKGHIMYMDLWDKYDIASIRGNQHFLLLIDDATRYITIKFLKVKSDATQEVQAYLTHLKIRSHVPYAIKVDCRTEFLNQTLQQWCNQNGIEIHATAPYSPSQNGVAEHMNCTLVKLAHAMLIAAQLPEFLWEPAIRHAVYIQN